MFSLSDLSAYGGLLTLLAMAPAMAAEPLSFTAALQQAVKQAPELAARNAAIEAAQAAAIPAAALPDPKLFVGIDNLPSNGPDRWRLDRDGMTMQKLGLMQEVPNAAKRMARRAQGEATIAQNHAERDVMYREVLRNTAAAWLSRYYLERKLALFDELEQENRLLAETTRAQLASGRSNVADVLMPRQEALMLAERRDELSRDRATAVAALRRWVGDPADSPLQGEPPVLTEQAARWRTQYDQVPERAVFDAGTDLARAQLSEAVAAKRPDWAVELTYQRRARQFGDMVSVQLTFDLPLFPATRQQPDIRARAAELRRIEAERHTWQREQARLLDEALAESIRLTRAITRQQTERLPLIADKLSLTLASYRAGKADLSEVLAVRREQLEARLQSIDLQAQHSQLLTQLHYRYLENTQ